MAPTAARRIAPWLLLGGTTSLALAALGFRPIDALLGAAPWLVPPFWCTLPPPRRRDLLRRRIPLQIALTMLAALLLGASNAAAAGAPLPWANAACFGVYLLAWLLLLHSLRHGLDVLLRPLVRRTWARGIAVAATTAVVGFPNLYVALQTHRLAVVSGDATAATSGSPVSFATSDGIALQGTVFEHPAADPATPLVVVCHGLGADRGGFAGYTALAQRLGAHTLSFDFRGHGRSGGFVSTLGADEVADLAAAVAWWRSQPGREHTPIVLVGVSMGGAVVLRAAGTVGAAGVLAESSYADLETMIEAQAAPLGPLQGLAVAAVRVAARWQLGIDPANVSPRRSLRELPSTVPVVLVHAGADRVVPLAEGERLAAARPGLRLHVVATAGHGQCHAVDPAGFERHLRELLTAARTR